MFFSVNVRQLHESNEEELFENFVEQILKAEETPQTNLEVAGLRKISPLTNFKELNYIIQQAEPEYRSLIPVLLYLKKGALHPLESCEKDNVFKLAVDDNGARELPSEATTESLYAVIGAEDS